MKFNSGKLFTIINDTVNVKGQMNNILTYLMSAFSIAAINTQIFEFGLTAIISILTIVLLFFKIRNEYREGNKKKG